MVGGRLTDFFWEHRESFPLTMKFLKEHYKENEWKNELAAYRIETMLGHGNWVKADEIFQSDEEKELLDNFLNYIGYDRARKEANRRRVWNSRRVRALSEVRNKRLADEEEVSSPADQTQEKLSGYDRESGEVGKLFREGGDSYAREEYERALETAGYRMQEAWQDSMLGPLQSVKGHLGISQFLRG